VSGGPGHGRYLDRCRELGRAAGRRGNTEVGSVVVLDGEIVAEAEEGTPGGPDPFGHAEIVAVRRALDAVRPAELKRATLYTTVEPCLLCAFAIREAGIGRVVMEKATPEIGGVTSPFPILTTDAIRRWDEAPRVLRGDGSEWEK